MLALQLEEPEGVRIIGQHASTVPTTWDERGFSRRRVRAFIRAGALG